MYIVIYALIHIRKTSKTGKLSTLFESKYSRNIADIYLGTVQ